MVRKSGGEPLQQLDDAHQEPVLAYVQLPHEKLRPYIVDVEDDAGAQELGDDGGKDHYIGRGGDVDHAVAPLRHEVGEQQRRLDVEKQETPEIRYRAALGGRPRLDGIDVHAAVALKYLFAPRSAQDDDVGLQALVQKRLRLPVNEGVEVLVIDEAYGLPVALPISREQPLE